MRLQPRKESCHTLWTGKNYSLFLNFVDKKFCPARLKKTTENIFKRAETINYSKTAEQGLPSSRHPLYFDTYDCSAHDSFGNSQRKNFKFGKSGPDSPCKKYSTVHPRNFTTSSISRFANKHRMVALKPIGFEKDAFD